MKKVDMLAKPLFAAVIIAASAVVLGLSAVQAEGNEDIDRVRAELLKMIPAATTAEITPSPIAGVYRVEVSGNFAFAYVDGDYVLFGDLYNTKEQVNLGEQARNERMAGMIKDVPVNEMIVFGPDKPKRTITVFTDIDCGYCRKLHREVPQLTEAGIQVRYLAFPRAGIGSDSYKKYVSVWCSDDQQTAMTSAKAGESVSPASCENPIADSYNLGQRVGVSGTPTIIFDDGRVTPGYIPYERLIRQLGLEG